MKKQYSAPELAEYGCLTDLTLGSGGTQPDYVLGGGGGLQLINNDCDASAPATACLVIIRGS